MTDITVGVSPPNRFGDMPLDVRRQRMSDIADAGLDHVFFADHVSFKTGMGMDGMVQAAALSQLEERLNVYLGVYLLALRHPVPVARQLATIAEYAPGRMVFGVGVGGEDRHEMEVCGIDPATRGRRTNECLEIIRGLMTGETVDFHGEFYNLDAAQIRPALDPPVPIVVGGRSGAALQRCAQYGDGWIAAWQSPERVQSGIARIDELASEYGRSPSFDHGLQLWCGLADSVADARALIAERMEGFYRIPFEKFERHSPYGSPEVIADFLRPFVEVGCRTFNLTICAASIDEATTGAGEIKRLLAR